MGLEIGLFDNRLSLDVDYYLDKSKDLIAYKGVSSVSGFSGKYVNYADVSNQGLDISLSGTIIKNKDWRWTAAFNMGYVKNKVTKANSTAQTKYLVQKVFAMPGEVYEGKPVNGCFLIDLPGWMISGCLCFMIKMERCLGFLAKK